MPAKQQAVDINDQPWRLVYRSLRKRGLCGVCNYHRKVLTICTSLDGIDRLDTEIHEACHALQGFASEEHTTEIATTLAKILWQIGYRLPGEHCGEDNTGEG
jgi:hypothetical protein